MVCNIICHMICHIVRYIVHGEWLSAQLLSTVLLLFKNQQIIGKIRANPLGQFNWQPTQHWMFFMKLVGKQLWLWVQVWIRTEPCGLA
jgi:hypothetical protein